MKNLPELAIRYRTITLFITTLLMAWGMIAYVSMPRREDPEFTIRTCVVTTRWSGVATEKVELLVTDPLEEAISGIEEVDVIRSTTTLGQSAIFVDLKDNAPASQIDQVWDDVRAEVAKVIPALYAILVETLRIKPIRA
jgi:multidrug efflux pump subunit AcrB